jgi:predicted RNA-binding Zn-ribbon protein involved in translation (DUF1610 family)
VKTFKLKCPICKLTAKAELEQFSKFLIYTCPKCHSNVVFYKHKTRILSDELIAKLMRQGRLKFCGNVLFSKTAEAKSDRDHPISQDDMTNLKILLATETDVSQIIDKL